MRSTVSVVSLHTADYKEIVRRLDKISDLQKRLLLALNARDPRTLSPRPKSEDERK